MEPGLNSPVCIETPRLRLLIPPPELAGRYLAYFERNRDHLARWDPPRPEGFYTEAFWRERLLRDRDDFAADRALRLALQWRGAPGGEVIGIWRQVAPIARPDGTPFEIAGTGGSWFRYAGGLRWGWQRDFFDAANAGAVFAELAKQGKLSKRMQERLALGSRMPGWVKRDDFDWYATIPEPRR